MLLRARPSTTGGRERTVLASAGLLWGASGCHAVHSCWKHSEHQLASGTRHQQGPDANCSGFTLRSKTDLGCAVSRAKCLEAPETNPSGSNPHKSYKASD